MQRLNLSPDDAVEVVASLARALAVSGRRAMLGIAGPPGVGKSTLAGDVLAALDVSDPGLAALLPMDGFHMRHDKLEGLGLVFEKGAPHTFEAEAFAVFLMAVRNAKGSLRGPDYSRQIEDVVDDAILIPAEARVVIVEGNYLLLPDPPWNAVRSNLDLAVFLDLPRELLLARLLARHNAEGLFDPEWSRRHVEEVDLRNVDRVRPTGVSADVVIALDTPV